MKNLTSSNLPKMNIDMFRQFLPKISENEIRQMKQMARQMGMTEDQIDEGMKIINTMKK